MSDLSGLIIEQIVLQLQQNQPKPSQKWTIKKINQFMQDNVGECMSWKKNTPEASNMGGVWQTQIRSAWKILESLLKTHGAILCDESLRILLVEVESIVN